MARLFRYIAQEQILIEHRQAIIVDRIHHNRASEVPQPFHTNDSMDSASGELAHPRRGIRSAVAKMPEVPPDKTARVGLPDPVREMNAIANKKTCISKGFLIESLYRELVLNLRSV